MNHALCGELCCTLHLFRHKLNIQPCAQKRAFFDWRLGPHRAISYEDHEGAFHVAE